MNYSNTYPKTVISFEIETFRERKSISFYQISKKSGESVTSIDFIIRLKIFLIYTDKKFIKKVPSCGFVITNDFYIFFADDIIQKHFNHRIS